MGACLKSSKNEISSPNINSKRDSYEQRNKIPPVPVSKMNSSSFVSQKENQIALAMNFKQSGNEYFKARNYEKALENYQLAIVSFLNLTNSDK